MKKTRTYFFRVPPISFYICIPAVNVRQVNDAFESTRRVGSRCSKYVTEREPRVADEELKEIRNVQTARALC